MENDAKIIPPIKLVETPPSPITPPPNPSITPPPITNEEMEKIINKKVDERLVKYFTNEKVDPPKKEDKLDAEDARKVRINNINKKLM